MSVVVFCEQSVEGFKKYTLEAMTYGRKLAESSGKTVIAVVNDSEFDEEVLKEYGIETVYSYTGIPSGDSRETAVNIAAVFEQVEGTILVLPFNSTGKNIAGQLGVLCGAGVVTSVTGMPVSTDPLRVPATVFAGKATAEIEVTGDRAVLAIQTNAIAPESAPVASVVNISHEPAEKSEVEIISRDTVKGEIPLPEAERVVSGGRGLKGPENWDILLDLANALGAATACSRPVSDSDWRPHHEHVGQTGIAIQPNLYIAIGISGAIQHLGGVNNSKTIVVINKDAEAPFFKAADYGVVGDLFEIVPKLTEAVRKFNENQ